MALTNMNNLGVWMSISLYSDSDRNWQKPAPIYLALFLSNQISLIRGSRIK